MTVRTVEDRICIEGPARVEDAEALFSAIQTCPGLPVDLSDCTGMHAAVLQVLLVCSPRTEGASDSPDLSDWIGPLLDGPPADETPGQARQDQ